MGWWNRWPEMVRDGVGSIPLVLIFVVGQEGFAAEGSLPRGLAIVVVTVLAVTIRRRWPVAAFTAALLLLIVAQTGLELLCVVSYTLVAYEPRAGPWLVAAVAAVSALLGYLQYWPALVLADIAGDLAIIAVVSVAPVLVGRVVRGYRGLTAELAARNAELVGLRRQEAEHAVQSERLRIARELHDVVAHHVSAMTVRARAGRHVAPHDPQAATDALAYIAGSGTEALAAMRSFVGTLREGSDEAASDREGFAPQPGLESLPALLESFRGTGLVVHPDIRPAPRPLPPALALNVYRIVQEALTNVIRHGAAERTWVRVWFSADAVHIEVDDDGRGLQDDGRPRGHGLVGVAERVALHDGTSRLGPSPRGGCRLTARMGVDDHHGSGPEVLELPAVGQ